jgi:hypothetical protein
LKEYSKVNNNNEDILIESSLNRILEHFKTREFVLITANRGELNRQENINRNSSLRKDLKKLYLGYVPVDGVGQEEDSEGNIHSVVENSFFVPNGKRLTNTSVGEPVENFKEKMLDLAEKYEQWGIVYGSGDGTSELIETSSRQSVANFNDIKFGIGEFFTRLKSGKRKGVDGKDFKFESVDVHHVENFMEGMAHNDVGLFVSKKKY